MRGLPKGRFLPDRSSVFDVVLAVTLAVVGTLDALRTQVWPEPHVVSAVLVAFSALCLARRRRRPLLAYAGTMGALTVIAVAPGHYESGVAIIIGFIATYTVAAYGADLGYGIAVGLILLSQPGWGRLRRRQCGTPRSASWRWLFRLLPG